MPSAGILTELTAQRIQQLEAELRAEVGRRLINSDSVDATRQDLVVRDLLPAEDLASGEQNGWNGTDRVWSQAWSSGTNVTANAYNDAYTIDSDAESENKVVGFWAIRQQTAVPETTEVKFLQGAQGDQGVKDEAQVEGLNSEEDATGYLASFIIYGAQEDGVIQHNIKAANDEQVVYGGATAETVGENISAPKVPDLLGAGGGGGGSASQQSARTDGGRR